MQTRVLSYEQCRVLRYDAMQFTNTTFQGYQLRHIICIMNLIISNMISK